MVAGLALLVSFKAPFSRKGTAVEPWKPTTAIVTTGPYRFTRNPAYLGMALDVRRHRGAEPALWVLVPLPVVLAVIDRGVIAREERYLERKFGEEYLDYKRARPALDLSSLDQPDLERRRRQVARAAEQAEDLGHVGAASPGYGGMQPQPATAPGPAL